ncbi:phosphatase PAP2 family protein [Sphingomonas koreensis]|nr:phosphatase PAP2 family protein [Sphingomonas koreensis]
MIRRMKTAAGTWRETALWATNGHQSPFDRRLGPLYAMIGIAIVFLAIVVATGTFSYVPEPLDSIAIFLGMVASIGYAARWLGVTLIAEIAESLALFCALAVLAPLCAAVLASTDLPLVDGFLMRLDADLFFGFDRRQFVHFANQWPHVIAVMRFAYNSLTYQPFMLLVALFVARRADRAWTFLGAWFLAATITLVIFPFAPALSTPPYQMHWVLILEQIRSGALRSLATGALTGIVAFPSFHAAAAVMLGWGFASFRWIGLPFIILNALMFVSAIFGGGHYLIDLIAGGAVALISLRIAKPMMQARPSAVG